MHDYGSTAIAGHRYRDAALVIDWLCRILGFGCRSVFESENGGIAHAELTLGRGMIMLGSGRDDEFSRSFMSPNDLAGIETRVVYITVPGADKVHSRAVTAGATISRPLHDTPHGFREFTVRYTEGHS